MSSGPDASPTIPSATANKVSTIVLDKALEAISEEVVRHKQLEGFLTAGTAQLAALAVEFVEGIGLASVRAAADRSGSTAIDKGDVEQGFDKLYGKKSERQSWYLGVAGVLAGGAIGAGVAVGITPPEHHLKLWFAGIAALGVLAFVLFVATFPKKAR